MLMDKYSLKVNKPLEEILGMSRISAYKKNWSAGEFFQFLFSL